MAQVEPALVLVTVDAGGDGDDGEIVLVAAFHRALGFEHADDGIIDTVERDPLAQRRTEGKQIVGQAAAQHADIAQAVHVGIQQGPALVR